MHLLADPPQEAKVEFDSRVTVSIKGRDCAKIRWTHSAIVRRVDHGRVCPFTGGF